MDGTTESLGLPSYIAKLVHRMIVADASITEKFRAQTYARRHFPESWKDLVHVSGRKPTVRQIRDLFIRAAALLHLQLDVLLCVLILLRRWEGWSGQGYRNSQVIQDAGSENVSPTVGRISEKYDDELQNSNDPHFWEKVEKKNTEEHEVFPDEAIKPEEENEADGRIPKPRVSGILPNAQCISKDSIAEPRGTSKDSLKEKRSSSSSSTGMPCTRPEGISSPSKTRDPPRRRFSWEMEKDSTGNRLTADNWVFVIIGCLSSAMALFEERAPSLYDWSRIMKGWPGFYTCFKCRLGAKPPDYKNSGHKSTESSKKSTSCMAEDQKGRRSGTVDVGCRSDDVHDPKSGQPQELAKTPGCASVIDGCFNGFARTLFTCTDQCLVGSLIEEQISATIRRKIFSRKNILCMQLDFLVGVDMSLHVSAEQYLAVCDEVFGKTSKGSRYGSKGTLSKDTMVSCPPADVSIRTDDTGSVCSLETSPLFLSDLHGMSVFNRSDKISKSISSHSMVLAGMKGESRHTSFSDMRSLGRSSTICGGQRRYDCSSQLGMRHARSSGQLLKRASSTNSSKAFGPKAFATNLEGDETGSGSSFSATSSTSLAASQFFTENPAKNPRSMYGPGFSNVSHRKSGQGNLAQKCKANKQFAALNEVI